MYFFNSLYTNKTLKYNGLTRTKNDASTIGYETYSNTSRSDQESLQREEYITNLRFFKGEDF